MNYPYLLLIILYNAISFPSISQNTIDSLNNAIDNTTDVDRKVELLIELVDQFQNPNDKLVYSRKAYRISSDARIKSRILSSNKMGICHGMLGSIDSSRYYFDKALSLSIQLGDSSYISSGYNGLGNIARMNGDLEGALANFLKALDFSEAVESKEWPADILTNISGVHYDLKNYESALENVLEAQKLYEDLDDEMNVSYTANLLAILYRAMGDLEKSYENNQKALKMLLFLKDTSQIIYNYINSIEILVEQNKYQEALNKTFETIYLAEEFGDVDPQITGLLTVSSINYRLGNLNQADIYVKKGISLAQRFDFRAQLPDAFMMQSLIEAGKGNYIRSYDLLNEYRSWTDSIRSKDIASRISELNVKYETEKKESEIEKLNVDRKIKDLQLSQANTRNSLLAILAVILVTASIFIFSLYRQKIRVNAQLRAINQTKDRLFSIVAHDVKNPLSAFKSFVGIWSENHDVMSPDEISKFIKQLDQSASNLLALLQNLLEWSISQSGHLQIKKEKLTINKIINDAISLFQGTIDSKSINVTNNVPDGVIIEADYKMLFSVIRNLLSNSVKFTPEEGEIIFASMKKDGMLSISIKDSGKGMPQEQVNTLFERNDMGSKDGTGIGMILCKEFVEKNNGKIRVQSEPGQGTTIQMDFPTK